jgi:hypothetical protein
MLPDHSAREAGLGCDIASAWFLAQVRWRPVCDDQIFGTLARLETTQPHVERTAIAALIKTQVSPWLERTCWLHRVSDKQALSQTSACLDPDKRTNR